MNSLVEDIIELIKTESGNKNRKMRISIYWTNAQNELTVTLVWNIPQESVIKATNGMRKNIELNGGTVRNIITNFC